jgi:branched-chain amino acid transport system ATP-binding protein
MAVVVWRAVAVLDVDRVTVDFGGVRALDAVTLHVAAGTRHALIGANGAGKTTLLHAIAGTVRPSGGRVLLGERDLTRLPAHRRARLGLARTFQQPTLLSRHSAAENVAAAIWRRDALIRPVVSAAHQRRVASEARAWLDAAGLAGTFGRAAGELSHAQQRQLEVAVALAMRPGLLLLDEPAAGLAAVDRSRLVELIRSLPASLTVVLVDHDLDLVYDIADSVTVLDQGRIAGTHEGRAGRAAGDPAQSGGGTP